MSITTTLATKPATDALTDLVETTDARAERCRQAGDFGLAREYDAIGHTLDGARTRLVEDGVEYLEAAWAFVDAGRRALADRHRLAAYLDAIAKAAR